MNIQYNKHSKQPKYKISWSVFHLCRSDSGVSCGCHTADNKEHCCIPQLSQWGRLKWDAKFHYYNNGAQGVEHTSYPCEACVCCGLSLPWLVTGAEYLSVVCLCIYTTIKTRGQAAVA